MPNMHPVLAAKISSLIQEVKEKHLWEKLMKIAKELGEIKPAGDGDFSHPSWTFEIVIDSKKLRIFQSDAMGGDYISVSYDGQMVFDAGVLEMRDLTVYTELFYYLADDPSKMIKVSSFIPGAWVELIDLNKIKSIVQTERQKHEQADREQKEAQERARPLNEEERLLAKAFGIQRIQLQP